MRRHRRILAHGNPFLLPNARPPPPGRGGFLVSFAYFFFLFGPPGYGVFLRVSLLLTCSLLTVQRGSGGNIARRFLAERRGRDPAQKLEGSHDALSSSAGRIHVSHFGFSVCLTYALLSLSVSLSLSLVHLEGLGVWGGLDVRFFLSIGRCPIFSFFSPLL